MSPWKPLIVRVCAGRCVPPVEGRLWFRRPAVTQWPGDPGYPSERLSWEPSASKHQRPRSSLSGDGVAPLSQILSALQRVAPGVVLSLELFNSAYWKGDPLDTARTGLAKMKAAARGAAGMEHAGAKSG